MKELELASTGRRTTQLGYGCSGIMGALSRKESFALLDAAFDAGIRHFDVAPVYGFGAAEDCLGQFLQQHRHQVTVTTKFGIPPARNQWLLQAAKGVVAPLMQAVMPLKKRMARVANRAAGTGAKVPFTAEMAMTSLHESLRKLRVERVDLFLMHEATAADLTNEHLLEALLRAEDAGKIGNFGVGSEAVKIPEIVSHRPTYCRVLQFDWSILQEPILVAGSFCIHHRSLSEAFRSLSGYLSRSPGISKRWSKAIGVDLSNPSILSQMMMRAALDRNPNGLLLFSSRCLQHIRSNVELAEAVGMADVASSFYGLVHEHKIFANR